MTVQAYDAVQALYDWLRIDTNAASIRALIYDGAAGIYQAADLPQSKLPQLALARHDASQRALLLAVTLHDMGDTYDGEIFTQQVGVCLWDVDNGQNTLRAVREQIKHYLLKQDDRGFFLRDVVTRTSGVLTLTYRGRTGYRQSEYYRAEYDLLSYDAAIMWSEE